jgi:hypothetical protein
MQALHSHVVKANISIHEIQGQLPHTVQTNAPTYMPFSSGMRDQVHSALDQGRFPVSIQTNESTRCHFIMEWESSMINLILNNQTKYETVSFFYIWQILPMMDLIYIDLPILYLSLSVMFSCISDFLSTLSSMPIILFNTLYLNNSFPTLWCKVSLLIMSSLY